MATLGVEILKGETDGETLPLIIQPKNSESRSVEYLKDWITDNQETINEYLLTYGAIMFRGFAIEEGIQFQEAVQCYEKELSNEYRGTSPRRLIPGTQFVFTASELPQHYPIPQHLEMSFLPAPPKRIFFCCLEAPTSQGGETSLCDFKKVYDQMDASVRERFEAKGVTYIRNYTSEKAFFSQPMQMKGWSAVFETDSKEEVEKELKKSNLDFKWSSNDHLTITNKAAAVEVHPQTGDKIWFNHLAVFHWAMLHQEYHYIYKRMNKIYYLFLAVLMWLIQNLIVAIKKPAGMAMHARFGDDTEIPSSDVSHVRDTIHKNMVFNRWRKGDLLMIDNFRVSHGRQPYSATDSQQGSLLLCRQQSFVAVNAAIMLHNFETTPSGCSFFCCTPATPSSKASIAVMGTLGVEILKSETDGETLPLIIQPKNSESRSVEYLKEWITDNQETINEYLLTYGAIMFRGFAIEEGLQFQEAVQCYEKELSNEYRGTSPRRLIPGTQFVFTASELPQHYPIPQHLEMSFLPAPPERIFFCCLEAPTSQGGETSLCDFKKVYDQMDASVRDKFEAKGVTYIRNYTSDKSCLSQPLQLKGWSAVFETDSKEEVEKELKKSNLDFKWSSNDHLTIINKAAAVEVHPQTGDKIWFNQVAIFHWAMPHQEYHRIYKRMNKIYYLFLAVFSWLLQHFLVAIKKPAGMAWHTMFGDGTEIPLSDLSHVRDTIHKNMVCDRWRKGDLLMIDNFRISHGRQPYSGKRKIVVAWSHPSLRPSFKH